MSRPSGYGVRRLQLSGEARANYGCIVNFSNGDCRWFPGPDGAREAADYADRRELKITAISPPDTIYRDLQGVRQSIEKASDGRRHDAIYFPESNILAAIGRTDLLTRQPRASNERR